MRSIKQILMSRDNMTESEANNLIVECKADLQERIVSGDIIASQDICQEYFGLEPDYIFQLLD